jgi:SOS response regulatory protein OraA/RecX
MRAFSPGVKYVDGLRFERLKGKGHHYPVLLHVGDSYVPVAESTISELKAKALLPGERFLELLIEKLGYSEYLRQRIREELKKTGDPVTQATVLQGIVRAL